ncbi:MAG: YybH family protein [Bacteroidota bacterium]
MRIIPCCGLLLTFLISCNAPSTTANFTDADKQAILDLLRHQQEDWNRGDIPAFMEGYQKSDSMQFIGRDGINFGWQKTLDNYRLRYPDTITMGKLRFEILRINPLSGDAAFLTGKFHLKRTIGDANGIFTLVLRKENGKWVVVYDHTAG